MKDLRGRRIVVTRSAAVARDLADPLAARGAVPVLFPSIETQPPESLNALDNALERAAQYDWVVFTSPAGVRAAFRRAADLGLSRAWAAGARFAAVGSGTAGALEEHGVTGVAVPGEFAAANVPDVLDDLVGKRLLLLRADRAGRVLPDALRRRAREVDDVVAYRTVPLSSRVDGPAANAVRAGVDAVTFTSPSTVEGFVAGIGDDWPAVVAGAAVVTIGPVTSAAATAAGFRVSDEADPHTIDGLVDAVSRHFHGSS